MQLEQQILQLFPEHLRFKWKEAAQLEAQLMEIRLRTKQPIILSLDDSEVFLTETGHLTTQVQKAELLSAQEMEQILKHICRYSFYAYEEEMKKGYISAEGGFRVGIAGEVVLDTQGNVRNIRYISSINIRIAHEKKGAAQQVIPWLYQNGKLYNTLLVSAPGCGKTTLLRDIIRLVSDGNAYAPGKTVGVVDERSEIAGCVQGVAQNDLGLRTDVLDGCPKAEGMQMLLRSMAPEVVAVDELGGQADVKALQQVLKCGCSVVATVHGEDLDSMTEKPFWKALFDQKIFERVLFLEKENGQFRVQEIYDAGGTLLAEKIPC